MLTSRLFKRQFEKNISALLETNSKPINFVAGGRKGGVKAPRIDTSLPIYK